VPDRKERLSVDVDEEVLRKFKQMVIQKHGKLRGNMSTEVTKALQSLIEHFERKG
jgi:metal-responsive CopG/Arc/MetJ family transcriptional regulator